MQAHVTYVSISTSFFNSVFLSKGVGAKLRPLQRTFTCCRDNTLFDKLNIYGSVIVCFS